MKTNSYVELLETVVLTLVRKYDAVKSLPCRIRPDKSVAPYKNHWFNMNDVVSKIESRRIQRKEFDLVAERYLSGETIESISASTGIYRKKIKSILHDLGVQLRSKRFSSWKHIKVTDGIGEKIARMYSRGCTLRDLSKSFGISHELARMYVKKSGAPLRSRGPGKSDKEAK